jgi:hypothetical protein
MSYTQTATFSTNYVSYCIDLVILVGAFMARGDFLRPWSVFLPDARNDLAFENDLTFEQTQAIVEASVTIRGPAPAPIR